MLSLPEKDRLRLAAPSPEAAERVIALLDTFAPAPRQPAAFALLAESVDETPDGLSEWVEALDRLIRWTRERERTLTLPGALGYVSCCSDSQASNPVRLPLSEVLEQMLADFGYEGESAL